MPESRDRLSRPEKLTTIFSRRRRNINGLNIFCDESAEESSGGTPFRWRTMPMTGLQGPAAMGRSRGEFWRGSLGISKSSIRRGRENIRPRIFERNRGFGTNLPYWYRRAPLNDITAVARAIERRRLSLSLQPRTPIPPLDQNVHDLYDETTPNAKVEPIEFSVTSGDSSVGKKYCSCQRIVAKLLLNITSQREEGENSDCLAPQKKLLNSIDTVGKAVMKELEKMKKTPSAKRAIRDRKIRTLMSTR